MLHTIKLCSLTNLISQKFSDLAVILAITVYERCTQVFSVAKTQGSSTSFLLSYHSAISENLFKGCFFTARVDFGLAFSINLLFSPDILGFRKAWSITQCPLQLASLVEEKFWTRVRSNFLACRISYLSISARDFKPDKKNCCLFIKHYINATTFKIIQLDARKRVFGQLAIPTGTAPRLNFSLPECFSKELEYWWKEFAISNVLNFNMTCSILASLRLKGGSIGFFRIDTS